MEKDNKKMKICEGLTGVRAALVRCQRCLYE